MEQQENFYQIMNQYFKFFFFSIKKEVLKIKSDFSYFMIIIFFTLFAKNAIKNCNIKEYVLLIFFLCSIFLKTFLKELKNGFFLHLFTNRKGMNIFLTGLIDLLATSGVFYLLFLVFLKRVFYFINFVNFALCFLAFKILFFYFFYNKKNIAKLVHILVLIFFIFSIFFFIQVDHYVIYFITILFLNLLLVNGIKHYSNNNFSILSKS